MKYLAIILLILPQLVFAARKTQPRKSTSHFSSRSSSADQSLFRIQGGYGASLFDPTDLATYQKQFSWNNTTAAEGTFDRMSQSDIGIGVRIGPGHLMVHYFAGSQDLKNTDITGTAASVKDSFNYAATYLFYDVPFVFGEFVLTTGLGIGKASKFDFHQTLGGSSNEDITWSANPTGYRARASLGYLYSNTFGVFLEVGYEMMKSTLIASADYGATINGAPIQGGQKMVGLRNNSAVEVDISGGRMAAGLMVMF